MTPAQTKEYPFGRDVDILVICHNELHRDYVVKAFKLKARYALWSGQMMGSRFSKVIVFTPRYMTSREQDWIDESVKTCLTPDGEYYQV